METGQVSFSLTLLEKDGVTADCDFTNDDWYSGYIDGMKVPENLLIWMDVTVTFNELIPAGGSVAVTLDGIERAQADYDCIALNEGDSCAFNSGDADDLTYTVVTATREIEFRSRF